MTKKDIMTKTEEINKMEKVMQNLESGKATTIMVLDSETIGFGIYKNNKVMGIKFNKEKGKFDKKMFDYNINNFQEITEEFKDQATNDLKCIKFKDSYSGRFKIDDIEKIEEVEKYFINKGYKLSKKNGYSIYKMLLSPTEHKKMIKAKKDEVMEKMKQEGFTAKYDKLAYDIGYTICKYDRKSKKIITFIERSFLVKEVFLDMDIMEKAYFFSKHPLYIEKLAEKQIEMLPMQEILDIMADDIKTFNTTVFSNYNAQFDTNAMKDTINLLQCTKDEVFKQMNTVWCLWRMACDTLYQRPSFVRKALLNGWISPSGKYFLTNAEVGYNYIQGTTNFEEEHTALSDARIETYILEYILRQQKSKVNERGIRHMPFKVCEISKFFDIKIIDQDKLTERLSIEEVNRLYKGNSTPLKDVSTKKKATTKKKTTTTKKKAKKENVGSWD